MDHPEQSSSAMDLTQIEQLLADARSAAEKGDFAEARNGYVQVVALQERLLGSEHPDTVISRQRLGSVLIEAGEFSAAHTILEQSLRSAEAVFGARHEHTARALSDFGAAVYSLGDYTQARALTEQAIQLREELLGSDHPDTIESMNNLGVILGRLGDDKRSLKVHEEALQRAERSLGENHIRTADALNNLGVRYAAQKKTYRKARQYYERSLAIFDQLYNRSHPRIAVLLNNLAAVLSDLGDDQQARHLLERSLVLHEEHFGSTHPGVAFVLTNLGDIFSRTEEQTAARTYYEKALVIRARELGPQHPYTLNSLEKLLILLGDMDDQRSMMAAMGLYPIFNALATAAGHPDASPFLPGARLNVEQAGQQLMAEIERMALTHRQRAVEPDGQDSLHQVLQLEEEASTQADAGDFRAAYTLLTQAIALREAQQGVDHPDLIPLLEQLANVLPQVGQRKAVLALRQRIADIATRQLGPGHAITTQALTELMMAQIYEYGDHAGQETQERLLAGMIETLGEDDPHVQMIRGSIERIREYAPEEEDRLDGLSRSERREEALAEPNPLADELLADVATVDWANLDHAYGSAADVPELLRLVLADNQELREEGFEALFSNIWHQGTVYEASAYAVPFLLRMLADPRTPDRYGVLNLLSSLASGNSYIDVHHDEASEHSNFRMMLAKQGRDFDSELQQELAMFRRPMRL
jgi:tetratricopeptide (TPR) repeat protein